MSSITVQRIRAVQPIRTSTPSASAVGLTQTAGNSTETNSGGIDFFTEAELFLRAATSDMERKLGPNRLRAIMAVARRFRAYYRRLYLSWDVEYDEVNFGGHIPIAACDASMALPDEYQVFREAYLHGAFDGLLIAVLTEAFGGVPAETEAAD